MKLFEIPVLVASLFGLGLLWGLDSPAAYADFTFGEPVDLMSTMPFLNVATDVIGCFSYDGLEMYIGRARPGGQVGGELWVLERASTDEDWGPPENLGPNVNSPNEASFSIPTASISRDGLTLYFDSTRPEGQGCDIYVTTRASKDAPWTPAVNMGPGINCADHDELPWISPDGLELYFVSHRSGGYGGYGNRDIWVARRPTTDSPWGTPVNIGPTVNSAYTEYWLSLSPDGLVLLFSDYSGNSARPGGYGGGDLWMSRRATTSSPWHAPVNLGPRINGAIFEAVPRVSADGRTLYFGTASTPTDPSTYGFWQAPIVPVVDFNGDGKVDGKEVLAMAQHWGQGRGLFDIGLSPMGDGVVDANDLTVLAGYVGQEVNDSTLIAHWALDETEDTTAYDSAGNNNVMVFGGAVWQPDGKIGGAISLNGTNGFLRTESPVLDPSKGPFSVIAWVKGGAPNKVIVSQTGGADWLYLNQFGMLTTDLKATGRDTKSLTSDAFVTDDKWHRVAFVWDGTNRTLQMDGIEVARDTQPNLAASSGSMHIGGGKNLTPATFWSGLIDDVRVYNRVVQP